MKYLFLFTVTPVQEFISQSRKLKDLFGSSYLLSEMSEIGLKICKREGAQEIFPLINEDNKSYPNRFLVEFKDKNLEEIKKIGNEIIKNLQDYIGHLAEKEEAKLQLKNYFSYYWAISEIEKDYKEAFDNIEKRLAGAKNTKLFNQQEEIGEKCSICGERRYLYKNHSLLKKNEKLCGVCFIKRSHTKTSFDSTADVALKYIFDKIDRSSFNLLSKDAQLFFEENLTKNYFEKNNITFNLEECKKEFKSFKEKLKENSLKQTSYYAVIMFDGDSMGEWLSGKNLDDKKELKKFHNFLSKKLLNYSKQLKELIKKYGIGVYAGGDDFLGFVSLPYIFDSLKEIKEKWDEIINESLKKEFQFIKDFTFSAGVVVAHYKTPLQYVLKEVREAEKNAKKLVNKNGIAFRVLKRSGEIREAKIKFDNLKNLNILYELIKEDFSTNFIAVLEKEFFLLSEAKHKKLLKAELIRTLNRAKLKDNSNIETFLTNFNEILKNSFIRDSLELLNITKFIKGQL